MKVYIENSGYLSYNLWSVQIRIYLNANVVNYLKTNLNPVIN